MADVDVTRGLAEDLARDWPRLELEKALHWARRKRSLGSAEGIRISDELRRQVIAMHPGWPSDADRAADLDAHVALSRRMKDAGESFGR